MSRFAEYSTRLQEVLAERSWSDVAALAEELLAAWRDGRQVFLCGNGGSAANAVHLANDLVYGVAPGSGHGLRAHALAANPSVLTCIANDECYAEVFAYELGVLGAAGDVLIVFSGSGNSPNIVQAVEKAREMGVKTAGVLGFDGGKTLPLVDIPIHFAVDDMQIAEDCQQIVGHMLLKWLISQAVGGRLE